LAGLPFLYIACGTEDFLFAGNQDFMKLMTEKKSKTRIPPAAGRAYLVFLGWADPGIFTFE